MSSTGSMFAASAAIQGVSAIGNAYSQSQALKSNAEFQKNLANINKNFADNSAEEAIKAGGVDAAKIQRSVKRTIGAQRAALAAQGIDLGTGSAQDILEDTRTQGAKDVVTVKNNAFREAWGFKVSAMEASMKGEFVGMAARSAAKNTLLTGGMQALGYGVNAYATYRKG